MAIARGTGASSGSSLTTTGSSITVTAPTSWASGSYGVLAITPYDNALATPPTITATGWSLLGNAVDSTYGRISLYGRFWATGETSATTWTITFDRVSVWTWVLTSYTGVDTTTPTSAVVAGTVTSTLSCTAGPITPTATTQWMLSYFSDRTTTSTVKSTWAPSAPLVEVVEINNSTKASAPWCTSDYCDDGATVGALTAQTRTSVRTGPAANVIWNSLAVLLNPAGVVTPPVRPGAHQIGMSQSVSRRATR